MGCDIHLHVERRIPGLGWTHLGAPEELRGRNYSVFSILANVRNGYGFAGVPTGSGFKPIAEPRGLPGDVTAETREDSDGWDCDGHSHSWLTLREVLEYNYTQFTTRQGVLSLEEFKRFDRYRQAMEEYGEYPCPNQWSGSVSGGGSVTIPDTEARGLLATGGVATDDKRTYVRTTWRRRYLDEMAHFLAECVPYVKYGLDDVRFVFWFDN